MGVAHCMDNHLYAAARKEIKVLDQLVVEPMRVQRIVQRTGLSTGVVQRVIANLSEAGIVKRLPHSTLIELREIEDGDVN